MPKDFSAKQIRTSKILASGGFGNSTIGLSIYSASISTDYEGGAQALLYTDVGSDVFLFVSGSKNSKIGKGSSGNGYVGVTLFGGDIVVSGTLYAEKQVVEVDETTTGSLSVSGSLFVSQSAVVNQGLTVNKVRGSTAVDDFHVFAPTAGSILFADASTQRVGINTTGPDRSLDILNVSDPQLRLTHTDGSKYVDFLANSNGDLEITGSTVNGHLKYINTGKSAIIIQSNAADGDAELGFSVDAGSSVAFSVGVDDGDSDKFKIGTSTVGTNTKLTILSAGQVGINTTGPDARLDVLDASAAQLRLTHTDGSKFVDLQVDTNHDLTIKPSSTGQIKLQPTTDSTDFFQVLDADGGTPVLNVDSTNERVGIGTTGPDRTLDVLDASNPQLRLTHTDGAKYTDFQVDTNSKLTVDAIGDIALSADGGNVYMDDGSNTIFDFNVDDTSLTIHDDTDTGDKFTITVTDNGATTIATVDDDSNDDADLTFDADGKIVIEAKAGDEAVFNEAGLDVDFRVESVDDTHMIFVEGSSNSVSIGAGGADTPTAVLEVAGDSTHAKPTLAVVHAEDTNNAIDVIANSLTTANVIDVSADALTTGGILSLVSNAGNNSNRTLVTVHNESNAATGVQMVHFKNEAIGGSGDPILLIESTAAETHAILELKNSNAATNVEPSLAFTSHLAGRADDMVTGKIAFNSYNTTPAAIEYASIATIASDITAGDEGGKIIFSAYAGGIAGTAASKNLFSIGGEDVANSTECEVVINEDSTSCNFRVESNNKEYAILVDGSSDKVLILSGGAGASYDEANGNDIAFYVSGAIGSKNTPVRGTSVFGGDLVVSGTGHFVHSDNGAGSGPIVNFLRTSTSPAAGDAIARLNFLGANDADQNVSYAQINVGIADPTDGSEDGALNLQIIKNGTKRSGLKLHTSEVTVNEDSRDIDFRVESNNRAHAIFVNAATDQVMILSGGAGASENHAAGPDINFYVSGSVASKGTAERGTSVFGGDMLVSGAMHIVSNATFGGTITAASIGADTDNSVVILNGSGLLKTDEIDPRVWGSTLVDTDGSGTNNELATWSDSDSIIGESNLTFDGSTLAVTGNQTISGNLIVNGTTTTINTVNLKVKDKVILIGTGSSGVNSEGGIAIVSGSNTAENALVIGRVAVDTWGAGKLDVQDGAINSVAGMTLGGMRASRFEIDGAVNYIDVSTDLQLIAAADITLDPGGGDVNIDGDILPNADNTRSLGSISKRWANIYTGDLHLRNEKGNWTIQEDEDKLIVINNITGKRYKMMLEPLEDSE